SPINGFNGAVGLTVSGLPAGVTASFSATSIPGGAGSVVLTVTVAPSAVAGTYTFQVTGTSGTLAHSVNVTLTVVAPAPVVNPSPTGLSFGSRPVGTTSAAQGVTLSNFGTAALAIGAIAAIGDFAQTNNCGTSLAVGASCTINVTFTPTVSGARAGTLSITDN